MHSKIITILAVVILLTGCSAATEPDYSSLPDTMHRPPQGMAQLVFYYPPSFFWSGITANIEVNGQAICGLKNGSFTIRNIPPGSRTAIAASLCSTNGTSRLTIKTVAGMTYYIRIVPNDQTMTGIIARHGLSALRNPLAPAPAPATTTAKGPLVSATGVFWVDLMEKSSAIKELQGLTLCPQCS